MSKILIQANNLDVVIDIFMFLYNHKGCNKQDVADYCGFSLRQVDYYTNACKYLELINDDWSFTPLGNEIFQENPAEVKERVFERIVTDEIIGKIFAHVLLFSADDIKVYSKELVKIYFPGYSETVYERRSDNMVKWCKTIIKYLKNIYG